MTEISFDHDQWQGLLDRISSLTMAVQELVVEQTFIANNLDDRIAPNVADVVRALDDHFGRA